MSSGVGGAGLLGTGRSAGGWFPPQTGAGPDPARGGLVPGYAGRGSSGAGAWFVGLLVLVAVPGVNLLLGPVAMMVAGLRGGRGLLEPERMNRRRAANWGLTFLLGEVVLIGAQLYIVRVVFGAGGQVPLVPWGVPALLALVLLLAHVVVCLVQGARARRGGVIRFGGIPFFR